MTSFCPDQSIMHVVHIQTTQDADEYLRQVQWERLHCPQAWLFRKLEALHPKVERMEPERSDDTFQKGISFFSGCHFRVKHVKFQGWYYPISLAQFFEGDGCRGEGAQKQTQGGRSKGRFKRGWNQLKMDRWRS